jgi:hypothetical protein
MSHALNASLASDPSWDDTYEDLAYTAFALATQADDPALGALYARVTGVLADWERIEADRRRLRGAAIAARAAVQVADAALDIELRRLAEAVLAECEGDRASELYRRYFPEPHEHVIALGLDGELPAASVAMAQLDESKPSDALLAHVVPLRTCLALGNAALMQRAEAYAELGRMQARLEAWLEGAAATMRTVRRDLASLGETRKLGHHWSASFFAKEALES